MGGESRKPSYNQTVTSFAENTTAHGVGRIHSTTSLRRLVWLSLFLGSFSFVVFQIITLIVRFSKFESETELSVSYNRHMSFPAVTICNLNSMRLSKILDPKYLPQEILSTLPMIKESVVETFRNRPWLLNTTGINKVNFSDPFWEDLYLIWNNSQTIDDSREKALANDSDLVAILEAMGIEADKISQVDPSLLNDAAYAVFNAYVDEETIRITGHQAQDMIVDCSFDGIKCNYTDFRQFVTDTFGNCYTFNHGRGEIVRHTTLAGPKHALRLMLNLEQYEYLTGLVNVVGMRVVLHDQGIRPFPREEGITVAPGYHTYVGINRNGITRLQYPYGNCTNGSEDQRIPGYRYSVMACMKLCIQSLVIENCGCNVPMMPTQGEHLPVCSFRDGKEDYLCMLDVIAKEAKMEKCDQCPESCNELSFNILLSFADWPDAVTDQKELKELVGNNEIFDSMPPDHRLLEVSPYRSNLLRLVIYFQELNDIQIVTRQGYSWSSLISDVGGQLGLWIGVSILTICESFELLFDLVMVFFKKSKMLGNAGSMESQAKSTPNQQNN